MARAMPIIVRQPFVEDRYDRPLGTAAARVLPLLDKLVEPPHVLAPPIVLLVSTEVMNMLRRSRVSRSESQLGPCCCFTWTPELVDTVPGFFRAEDRESRLPFLPRPGMRMVGVCPHRIRELRSLGIHDDTILATVVLALALVQWLLGEAAATAPCHEAVTQIVTAEVLSRLEEPETYLTLLERLAAHLGSVYRVNRSKRFLIQGRF